MPDLQPPVLGEMLRAARETAAVAVVLSRRWRRSDRFLRRADRAGRGCRRGPPRERTTQALGISSRRRQDRRGDEPSWTALDPGRRTLVDIDEPATSGAGLPLGSGVPHEPFMLGSIEVEPLRRMGTAAARRRSARPRRRLGRTTVPVPVGLPPDDATSWAWHVHAFLIRHPDGPVLVDTGIGDLGRPPYDVAGRLEEELAAVHVSPESVRHAILTHLHGDHAGAACPPRRTPPLPERPVPRPPGRLGVLRRPTERPTISPVGSRWPASRGSAPRPRPIGSRDRPGLCPFGTPLGHTPGHRVVRLEEGDATLLLLGDLLHTTPQVAHPTWLSNHDEDPELAAEHRALWIDAADREGWAVCVGHFGRPFGHVAAASWSPV